MCFSSVFFAGCWSRFDGDFDVEAGAKQYDAFANKLNNAVGFGKSSGNTRSIDLFGRLTCKADLDINGFKIKADVNEDLLLNTSFTANEELPTSQLKMMLRSDISAKTEVSDLALSDLISKLDGVNPSINNLLSFVANKDAKVKGDLYFDNGILYYLGSYNINGKVNNDAKICLSINNLLGQSDGSWLTPFVKYGYDLIDGFFANVTGEQFIAYAEQFKAAFGATVYFDFSDTDYRFKISFPEDALVKAVEDEEIKKTLKLNKASLIINFNDKGTFTGAKAEYDITANNATLLMDGLVLNGNIQGSIEFGNTAIKVNTPSASNFLDLTPLAQIVMPTVLSSMLSA